MPTLERALHTFLQVDRARLTNKQYTYILSPLIAAIGPARDTVRVSYEDLADYFYPLVRDHELKLTTARNYLLVIKVFFNWCAKRRYVDFSPAHDLKVRQGDDAPPLPRSVPPDELFAMVDLASYKERDYAIMLFLADTGCRVSGIASLTVTNLNLDKQMAFIHEKAGRWHRVDFGEDTAEALRAWLKVRPPVEHDSVFTQTVGRGGKPMTSGNFRYLVKRLAFLTDASRSYTPHAIRYSLGHAWGDRGVPMAVLMRKLGQRDYRATQRYNSSDEVTVAETSRDLSLAALRDRPRTPEPPIRLDIPRRRQSG